MERAAVGVVERCVQPGEYHLQGLRCFIANTPQSSQGSLASVRVSRVFCLLPNPRSAPRLTCELVRRAERHAARRARG